MNPNIQPLVAPNAVKNASLNDAKNNLYPQLFLLGLNPTGLFGVATASMVTGSGPGGSFTEQEMVNLGLLPDDRIYLQFQLNASGDLFDVNDSARILEGYRYDNQPAPDPNFLYADRVRALFERCGLTLDAADSAMLNIPSVLKAVGDAMTEAVTPAPATPAFQVFGPVRPDVNNSLKGGVSIHGGPTQQLAVIPGPPPTVWNQQGQDVTAQVTAQGVDVNALWAAMQQKAIV